jgi:hypothetical protein
MKTTATKKQIEETAEQFPNLDFHISNGRLHVCTYAPAQLDYDALAGLGVLA